MRSAIALPAIFLIALVALVASDAVLQAQGVSKTTARPADIESGFVHGYPAQHLGVGQCPRAGHAPRVASITTIMTPCRSMARPGADGSTR